MSRKNYGGNLGHMGEQCEANMKLAAEVKRLRAELTQEGEAADHWKELAEELRQECERLREALRGYVDSPAELDHPGMGYVVLQVSRHIIEDACAALEESGGD